MCCSVRVIWAATAVFCIKWQSCRYGSLMRNTADTWCTVPIHGQRGSVPFTSNQMIKNLVVSMGWYLNTRWCHHVAVISEMIIKIWAEDREYIDPNSRLGCDLTVLTHPYRFRTGCTRSEPIRLFVTSPDLTLRLHPTRAITCLLSN